MDLLRDGTPELASAVAVIFTSVSKRREHPGQRKLTLGKARLASRLQLLLRTGRIPLLQTAEADALALELLNYEMRVDANAHARFGAFKTGTHDARATALGLAVQVGLQTPKGLSPAVGPCGSHRPRRSRPRDPQGSGALGPAGLLHLRRPTLRRRGAVRRQLHPRKSISRQSAPSPPPNSPSPPTQDP